MDKIVKRKPKKAVSSTVSASMRLAQSRRDKAKSMETPNVYHSETFLTNRFGDLKSKDDPAVLIAPVSLFNGVADFIEARKSQIVDSEKHPIVDVKRMSVECVNASTNGPIVVVAMIGLESKRTIIPVGGKSTVSFQNFSSKEGSAELSLVVPHFGGTGAEAWFVVKTVVSTRFVY